MEFVLSIIKITAVIGFIILGIVIASTAIIAPSDSLNADTGVILVSILVFVAGVALGLFMGWLEKKYKPQE